MGTLITAARILEGQSWYAVPGGRYARPMARSSGASTGTAAKARSRWMDGSLATALPKTFRRRSRFPIWAGR